MTRQLLRTMFTGLVPMAFGTLGFSLPTIGLPSPTAAQGAHVQASGCTPGGAFCFSVDVGSNPPAPAVELAQVIVEPAPQVIVQPPPPVIVQQPPPPPPVIYTDGVPPTVIVQAPPQPVVNAPPPPRRARRAPRGFALHGRLGGVVSPDLSIGGAEIAFRYRPNLGHFAFELGVGAYAGSDYNGLDRVEAPVMGNILFFLNPQDRFQIYGIAGVAASVSHAEGSRTGRFVSRDYVHIGGQAGAGAEFRVTRRFAVSVEARGFLRQRIDDNDNPEFVEVSPEGRVRSTDTSGGLLLNVGTTFYF